MPIEIEKLIDDLNIEDIILNPRGISYYKGGNWKGPFPSPITQKQNLLSLARNIADKACLSLGRTQPTADAFINLSPNTPFRAHVVIPPMINEGPEITLRRLPKLKRFPLKSFTPNIITYKLVSNAVEEMKSILIVGATGSGKTSLLTSLFDFIPALSRVLVLEDSPELPLPNNISTKLTARPDRFGFREGATWDLSHLVFESLRMRPDRLILGECRGPEALALATALQTGHRGLITTLHAGSCQEGLNRFQELAQSMSSTKNENFSELWDLVLFIEQNESGIREIKEVTCPKKSQRT